MFAVPRLRTALSCKRVKISTPFRPLTTTFPRLSENDIPPGANEAIPNATEAPSDTSGPSPNQELSDTDGPSGVLSRANGETSTTDGLDMGSDEVLLDRDGGEGASIPPQQTEAQPELQWQLPVRSKTKPAQPTKPWKERMESLREGTRLPRSVQAAYLKPLKRKAEYGLPVCDLQLRSYSVRHVEFFADFALRAAYYLNLPASGPVPLPRITERWTVIKSPFIYKKRQENFERITLRRLVQIKDGHPDSVQAWLAFLRKHAFHGVGMKANVYDHVPLDFVDKADESAKNIEKTLESELARFGTSKNAKPKDSISKLLETDKDQNKGMPLTDVRKG